MEKIRCFLQIIACLLIFALIMSPIAASQSSQALYNSALVLFSEGKREDIIPLLHKIVKIEPDFKDAYQRFSELCFYYGQKSLLIETTKELIRKDPSEGRYYLDLTKGLFQEGKIDLAKAVLSDKNFKKSDYSEVIEAILQ